jgi:mono/diheme cytochrome c family protein
MIDGNGDGVAESTERVAYLAGTIEEHGGHALRRGPDGSLMYMSGNLSGSPLNQDLDPASLVLGDKESQFLSPLAIPTVSQRDGVHSALYRVDPGKPLFTAVAGGNRNTYDFAYNLLGEVFWFDSDSESELGVPWYREVRTVHGIPGGNFGYRNGSGKYPPWYIDSLPPVRDVNRGSPVGVEFYQSYAYPRELFDNLLEGDWSRGRLLFTALTADGATYRARTDAAELIHGEPLNITDMEVGPDGMLYFVTGGRNTEGGLWRLRYTGPPPAPPDMTGILAVVRQPQPLSAWGWAAIEKARASMGASFARDLERLARSSAADPMDRVRAVYEMQRHGVPVSDTLLQTLASDRSQPVRAAAVHISGLRSGPASIGVATAALRDADPLVRRRGLEAVVRMGQSADRPSLVSGRTIYPLVSDRDRFVRWAARVALERTAPAEWRDRVLDETNITGVMEGMLAWVRTAGAAPLDPVVRKQLALMKNPALTPDDTLRLLRVFQFTMTELPGGLSPAQREELFSIWAPRFPSRSAASCAPASSAVPCAERLNREIALTLAYTQQPAAIAKILAAMPEGDAARALQLHYVYGLRTIKVGWTPAQKAQLTDVFARASRWRGGMFNFVALMFEDSMAFFTPDERQAAYAKAPNLAPIEEAAAVAGGAGPLPATPPGGRGARGPGLTRQELFERLLFVPGAASGAGNPQADPRQLFATHCASCHKPGNGEAGDLSRHTLTRRQLLESVVFPHQKLDFVERLNEQQIDGLVSWLQRQGR